MIGGFGTQSRKTSLCVITVSEPQNNPENTPTLLVAPIDWKLIWNDKGSGARKDGSMWEAIPPDSNYKCLGSIPQKGYKKPVLSNYRCVHVSLTEKIVSNSVVWSDKGSNADKKVTMFRLPNTNSFVAVKGRINKIETYDLKANAAVKPNPKLVEEKLAMRMEKVQQDPAGQEGRPLLSTREQAGRCGRRRAGRPDSADSSCQLLYQMRSAPDQASPFGQGLTHQSQVSLTKVANTTMNQLGATA